ncbi:MAG: aminoacyl-tRNA hydrolase [Elusimicrobia bacterium]|nr:aminoacyl-tRNA hydrolase [Elusimicrobiota bacterium]
MALRLVVGLGNPGPEYERTRHNVGFRLVDRLVGEADPFWKDFQGLGAVVKRADGLWLAKPTTFMNDSGNFVRAFSDYHKISPAEMLLVFDEIALPLGRIRVRRRGSAGGQKGMLSVIKRMGTDEIPRLRVGIGPQPERMDSADFVLSRFKAGEEKDLDAALGLAEDAVRAVAEGGVDLAMNRFNAGPADA